MITDRQLALIAPNCPRARRREVLPHLQLTLERYKINTLVRAAAFIANLLEESGEFLYTAEIWGNTPAQRRYDTGQKAIDLGNTPEADGDGKLRKGYGLIQTTGGKNQRRVLKHLGLDPEQNPKILGEYPWAALSAGFFWADNKLNALADTLEGDWDADELAGFKKIVKRINGGYTNLDKRIVFYRRACHVLRTVPGFGTTAAYESAPATAPAPTAPATMTTTATAPSAPPPDASTPTSGPIGTMSNAPLETRVHQTQLVDYAAQQVTPTAAKTFARSTTSKVAAPVMKIVAWLGAALQAGSIFAWLGTLVAVAGVAWLIWHYRRTIKAHAVYFYSKVKGQFANEVSA